MMAYKHQGSSKGTTSVNMTGGLQNINCVMNSLTTSGRRGSEEEYEWFFWDENDHWIKYAEISTGNYAKHAPSIRSDDIEKHFRKHPDKVMITKNLNHTYELNLTTMTQTNLKSKVQRPMRRVAKNSGGSRGNADVPLQGAYVWYYRADDGSWAELGSRGNSNNGIEIEKHYQTYSTSSFHFTAGSQSYVLDFANMIQTNTTSGKVREVCRRNLCRSMNGANACSSSSNSVPTRMVTQTAFRQVNNADFLGKNYPENLLVRALLRTYMPNCNPNKIYKINNPHLRASYDNNKAKLQSLYQYVNYREACLFHGTNSANVQFILDNNIDWKFTATNAVHMMGRGAYFFNNAQTASSFGNTIFICRVLVGLTTTDAVQVEQSAKYGFSCPADTKVDREVNPTVFVKYDSQEYYPEYYAEL